MARKKSTEIVDESGLDIEQFGTIFDQLGAKDPAQEPKHDTTMATPAPGVDVSALMAKIDALSGTVNALASRPYPQQQYAPAPAQPSSPQWDWEAAAMEPEKLGPTIAQYTNYVIEQREAQQRAEQERIASQRQATNALWEDFSSVHPDYAGNQQKVGIAYQQVSNRLAERGISVADYAALHKADLFSAVTKEYDSLFTSPKLQVKDEDADDSNRTSGIFGGFESGGQPAKGKEAPGDMIKDLKDIQRASGFF